MKNIICLLLISVCVPIWARENKDAGENKVQRVEDIYYAFSNPGESCTRMPRYKEGQSDRGQHIVGVLEIPFSAILILLGNGYPPVTIAGLAIAADGLGRFAVSGSCTGWLGIDDTAFYLASRAEELPVFEAEDFTHLSLVYGTEQGQELYQFMGELGKHYDSEFVVASAQNGEALMEKVKQFEYDYYNGLSQGQ